MTNQKSTPKSASKTSAKTEEKKGLADRIGDAVESLGDRISDAGAPGIGKKIHDAGDRIESSHRDASKDRLTDRSKDIDDVNSGL